MTSNIYGKGSFRSCSHYMGYSFDYQQGFFCMHNPTDRIAHTMAFVSPVVEHWLEQERSQWVKSWGIDPTTHRTISIRSTTELHHSPDLEKGKKKIRKHVYYSRVWPCIIVSLHIYTTAVHIAILITIIVAYLSMSSSKRLNRSIKFWSILFCPLFIVRTAMLSSVNRTSMIQTKL